MAAPVGQARRTMEEAFPSRYPSDDMTVMMSFPEASTFPVYRKSARARFTSALRVVR